MDEDGLIYSSDVDWFLENASQQFGAPPAATSTATTGPGDLTPREEEGKKRTPRTPRPAGQANLTSPQPTTTTTTTTTSTTSKTHSTTDAPSPIVNRPGRAMTIGGDGSDMRPPFLQSMMLMDNPMPKKSNSDEDIAMATPYHVVEGRPRSTSIAVTSASSPTALTRASRSSTVVAHSPPTGHYSMSPPGHNGLSPGGSTGGVGGVISFKYPFRTRQRRSQSMFQQQPTPLPARKGGRSGTASPFISPFLPLPPSLEESTPLSDFTDREKRLWHRISARLSPDLGDDVMEGIIYDEYMEKKRKAALLEKMRHDTHNNEGSPPGVQDSPPGGESASIGGGGSGFRGHSGYLAASAAPQLGRRRESVGGMRRAYKQAKGKIKRSSPNSPTNSRGGSRIQKRSKQSALDRELVGEGGFNVGRRGQSDSNLTPIAAKVPSLPLQGNNSNTSNSNSDHSSYSPTGDIPSHAGTASYDNFDPEGDWEEGEQETLADLIMGGLPDTLSLPNLRRRGRTSGGVVIRSGGLSPGRMRHAFARPHSMSSPASPSPGSPHRDRVTSPPNTPPSPHRDRLVASPPPSVYPSQSPPPSSTFQPIRYNPPAFSSFDQPTSSLSTTGRTKSNSTSNLTSSSSLSLNSTKNSATTKAGRGHRSHTSNNTNIILNATQLKEVEEIRMKLRDRERALEEAKKLVEQRTAEVNDLKQKLWERMNSLE